MMACLKMPFMNTNILAYVNFKSYGMLCHGDSKTLRTFRRNISHHL
jgi:hypothetical protein